ncbi:MAG TPA: hypothetical protein VE445_08520 [Nitrososphaeraceae archaeon]|nr:hypothetical protein [Nitrososphaeraceae archaeon]
MEETSGETTTTFVSYATAFNAIFLLAGLVLSRMIISFMAINSRKGLSMGVQTNRDEYKR